MQEGYPVKQEYVYNVKNYYEGKVTNLDFAGKTDGSRDAINEWVEDKTNNKIKDFVPEDSITPDIKSIRFEKPQDFITLQASIYS